MPRNISFFITKQQFKDRTKDVTRRLGWKFLKSGDLLMGCEKCQGLKPGKKLVRLGLIRVLSARREPLDVLLVDDEYGQDECVREGFPDYTPREFVDMFCREMKCEQNEDLTRIEFEYLAIEFKEGDPVKIDAWKWEGHYWHDCKIVYLSPCGKYARVSGGISWGRKSRETTIPTELLRKI